MKLVIKIILCAIILMLSACSEEVDNNLEFEFYKEESIAGLSYIIFDIDLDSLQVDSIYVSEINDEMILNSIFMPDNKIIVDLDGAIIFDDIKNIIGALNGYTICSHILCSPLGAIAQYKIVLSDSDTIFDIKFSEYSDVVYVESIEGDYYFFFKFKRGDANEFDEIIDVIFSEYNE